MFFLKFVPNIIVFCSVFWTLYSQSISAIIVFFDLPLEFEDAATMIIIKTKTTTATAAIIPNKIFFLNNGFSLLFRPIN